MAYRIEGTGPPLVMIQGVGAYGTAHNPQVEILLRDYTCLTFDNRGVGESQPVGKDLSVPQLARDTLALMDHLGWKSAHLIGHSLGGLICLEIALRAKSRVTSLTLLNTFATGAAATRLTPKLLWIGLRLRFAPRKMRQNAFLELVLSPSDNRGDRTSLVARMANIFGHDIADLPPISERQMAAMAAHDLTTRLGELAGIPTLVISGEKDPIATPESGKAIAAGIPGATYVEIAGASHAFPIMEVARCAALIMEHLASADKRRIS